MINSLLVVCFYNGLKRYQVGQFFKICGKIVRNVYKSTFMEYCVKSTINTRGILPIFYQSFLLHRSIMVAVCLIKCFVFQPPRCIHTSDWIGGYCRLKVF